MLLTVVEVLESPLCPQDEQSPNTEVGEDGEGAEPPDYRVSDQVDLSVILDPEILEKGHEVRMGRKICRKAEENAQGGRAETMWQNTYNTPPQQRP